MFFSLRRTKHTKTYYFQQFKIMNTKQLTSILSLIADWRNGQGHRQRQTGIKRQRIIISTGPPRAIHDNGPTSH